MLKYKTFYTEFSVDVHIGHLKKILIYLFILDIYKH